MSFLENLPRPFFVLAPMDDVTDAVFRRVVHGLAPADLYFTEFVNADGLQSPGRTRLLKKLRFAAREGPLVAQIWGLDPENFYKTAKQIADGTFAREMGLPDGVNFAGVDLNMGCPQKSEIKSGACAALINNRDLAAEIIAATKAGLNGRLPLSVKTRLGYSQVDLTWFEFLLKQNLDMLTVHGRTKAQMSKVPADWNVIGEITQLRDRIAPGTLIVGNGDVRNRQHGYELAKKYGLDGIMLGRGIFQDPFAMAHISPWTNYSPPQKLALYERHVHLFAATWRRGERPIQTLNKFCKLYVNGFDGAKELREELMRAGSTGELLQQLSRSVAKVKNTAASLTTAL
jgi:tRNA-dihydrouridine synthase